jgi:molybdopterin converting factor small subunit
MRKVRVEVRLYATLADHVAEAQAAVPFAVKLPGGAIVDDLIEQLRLPPDEIHLAVVDGRVVHDRAARLADGSRIALFPPIGGG